MAYGKVNVPRGVPVGGSAGGGVSVPLEVSVDSGAVVNAVNGDTVITATSENGSAALYLTKPGIWDISASMGSGKTGEAKVTVADIRYNATFRNIHVVAEPENSGIISGSGLWADGETVTLEAAGKEGYVFDGWKENDNIVANTSLYSFTASQNRSLTATFLERGSVLPSGYQQAEYVHFSGGAYIDPQTNLDLSYTGQDSIEFDLEFDSYKQYAKLIYRNNGLAYQYVDRYAQDTLRVACYVAGNSSSQVISNAKGLKNTGRNVISINHTKAVINDVSTTIKPIGNIDPFVLMGMQGNDVNTVCVDGKLYSCTIKKSSVEKRNFIPCVNPDGIAGLYDTVESAFFGNAGPGTITAGPIIG